MAPWGCLISQNRCLRARWLLGLPDLRKHFAEVHGSRALISLHFPAAPIFDSYSLFQQSEFCPHMTGMKVLFPGPLWVPGQAPRLAGFHSGAPLAALTTRNTDKTGIRCPLLSRGPALLQLFLRLCSFSARFALQNVKVRMYPRLLS